jgi:hypothetical protein
MHRYLALVALLLSGSASAQGVFATYAQWDRSSENDRECTSLERSTCCRPWEQQIK